MRRRQILRLAQGGLISAFTAGIIADAANSQTNSTLKLEWLGHMSFLVSGDGVRFLTHPFRPAGCTAKLAAPKSAADYILISSRLLDEGFWITSPKIQEFCLSQVLTISKGLIFRASRWIMTALVVADLGEMLLGNGNSQEFLYCI